MSAPDDRPSTPFRILSLDGGGSWSIIQVRALCGLFSEATTGHQVLRSFDLVAANSGGSIVAAGLAADLTLAAIRGMFEDGAWRRRIFVKLPWYRRLPFSLVRLAPKYDAPAKLAGLVAAFTPASAAAGAVDLTKLTLSQVHQRIAGPRWLIIAFDFDRLRATFFRSTLESPAGGTATSEEQPSFIEVVHASTNAPVLFFDRPAVLAGKRFWDGAVGGYNNPILAAVTEALSDKQIDRRAIRAISLGTGGVLLPRDGDSVSPALLAPREAPSTIGNLRKMATSILDDPPDAATFIAHVALGGATETSGGEAITSGPIVRLSPLIQPVRAGPDQPWSCPPGIDLSEFQRLMDLQLDAIDDADVSLINRFCDAWMADGAPNQPIRADRNLQVEIGHGRYGAALAAARAIVDSGSPRA